MSKQPKQKSVKLSKSYKKTEDNAQKLKKYIEKKDDSKKVYHLVLIISL